MRVSRLACVLVLSAASHVLAQDAVEWFGKATYTTNADEQVYYYKKALEADPGYSQAAHNLAGVYYRKGQVRKSIALYENLIRTAKAYHQTFYNLACCYARVGDADHALKALTRAFQKGFHDRKLVERDEDLAEVRSTPQYQALAARYLGGHGGAHVAAAPAATMDLAAAPAAAPKPKARKHKAKAPGAQLAAAPAARKARAAKAAAAGALEPVEAGVVVEE